MNTNDPMNSLATNTEYASQWIAYLKKKNLILTIVWPLLLCSTIAFGIAGFYFYQLSHSTNLALTSTQAKLENGEQVNQAIKAELELSVQNTLELEENISLLSTAKLALEEQKGDSVSQLDLSGQIVKALKEKIIALEAEKELAAAALNKTRSLVALKEEQTQSTEQKMATTVEAHNKERFAIQKKYRDGQVAFKALMSRQKEMRDEMNRLADLVERQKRNLNQQSLEKNELKSALTLSENNVKALEIEYKALEDSLKLAVQPINTAVKAAESRVEPTLKQNTNDGLEEIRAPKPVVEKSASKKKSSAKATFDYDQISLED